VSVKELNILFINATSNVTVDGVINDIEYRNFPPTFLDSLMRKYFPIQDTIISDISDIISKNVKEYLRATDIIPYIFFTIATNYWSLYKNISNETYKTQHEITNAMNQYMLSHKEFPAIDLEKTIY
jgi:hypothetical protein